MKVTIKSTDNTQHFTCSNEQGHSISIHGDGTAVSPMQTVLMAMASCSSVDVETILRKMRQGITSLEVNVTADRKTEVPKVFTHINMHYVLYGEIKEKKAEKAIKMSLEKYCSVSLMMVKAATISSSFEIRPS